MKNRIVLFVILCAAALANHAVVAAESSTPAPSKLSKETMDDIAKHRTIAAAHEAAAKCLESGKSDEECEGKLLAACKGIAIGRFCGMKH